MPDWSDCIMTDYTSAQNKLTDATTSKRLYFCDGKHAFIPIDRSIIEALNLEESDRFTEQITKDGILLRRVKEGV